MKFPKLSPLSALALFLGSSLAAHAATLTTNATWDSGTVDTSTGGTGIDTGNAESDVRETRVLRQSFTLSSSLTVGSIYLGAEDYQNAYGFTLGFYSISDPLSTDQAVWDAGVLQGSSISISAGAAASFGDTTGNTVGNQNMRIDLSPAEQVTLAAGNYYLQVSAGPDAAPSSAYAFKWDVTGTNSPTNAYAPGRRDDHNAGIPTDSDYVMSLVAVPEPSAALLSSLAGGLMLLARRRRV